MKLEDWAKIKKRFKNNLLLGNGASIAIDNRLSYRSLYEQVCESGRLNDELLSMFEHYRTTNFEFILKLLLEASQVNGVLNIEDYKTKEYYYELRDALISTIRDIHPTYPSVKHLLIPIANFLANFTTVLSLNYDLLVYWSMLVGNEERRCQWFKDCFNNGDLRSRINYLYKPYPPATGSTLVFYPYGGLFLAKDIYGDEVKLSHSSEDCLLETILSKWKGKDYIPLFVSEGTTTEKFRAITRSNYLNSVYDSALAEIKGSLVIYGWAASGQDEHIFNAIDHEDIADIAISVHTENPNWESYCVSIEDRIARTHHLRESNLYFFDSQCNGCWIY